jgi:homocysteine S-methyltransferase
VGSHRACLDLLCDGEPVVLDGPMGTALEAAGVPTPAPLWSAAALDAAPERVQDIHRSYVGAGA